MVEDNELCVMISFASCRVKVRSDGVVEATLFIRLMTPEMFRKYSLVAENSIAVSTYHVSVTQSRITFHRRLGANFCVVFG